jgi:DNA invertase Pin-like site-specific DNA recombinase
MNMTDFIAYYRVSTDRQGASGLGLEAQRRAVADFAAGRGGILAEFTEVESGRKNDRPELRAALAACQRSRAVLVIAKLDRLARNVAFIAGLMESGVEFVAVDMPQANRLTIHILAAVAEHEREMISERTRVALAAAKARGVKLGNPAPNIPAAVVARLERMAKARATVMPLIERLRGQGMSLRAIAADLNDRRIPSATGRQWYASSVRNVLISPN